MLLHVLNTQLVLYDLTCCWHLTKRLLSSVTHTLLLEDALLLGVVSLTSCGTYLYGSFSLALGKGEYVRSSDSLLGTEAELSKFPPMAASAADDMYRSGCVMLLFIRR